MAMDSAAPKASQVRYQRDAARRRHVGAAHHHDAHRPHASAGREPQACRNAMNTVDVFLRLTGSGYVAISASKASTEHQRKAHRGGDCGD